MAAVVASGEPPRKVAQGRIFGSEGPSLPCILSGHMVGSLEMPHPFPTSPRFIHMYLFLAVI